jgi:DNA mismatch repair protein MutS2
VAIASLAGLRGRVRALDDEWALVETEAARVRVRCADLVILAGSGEAARPQRPVLVRQPRGDRRERGLTVRGNGRGGQRWQAIDLHGLMPSEALAQLDDFLFACWDEGWQTVAVVHGKGAGTLRAAVRSYLVTHPAVHHILGAPAHSGGDGVTLVQIRRKSDLFDDFTTPDGS